MNPLATIHESWKPCVSPKLYTEPLLTLNTKILPKISYQPRPEHIFRVFQMPLKDIKVVILGQDPYPTPGDAIGYAFLNPEKVPKSLQIIIKEIITSDYNNLCSWTDGEAIHKRVQPMKWPEQGIFLLNTALTVKTGTAGSHLKYWEGFTKSVVQFISSQQPCIWLLWGKKAQQFIPYINKNPFNVKGYSRITIENIPIADYNYILTAPHPAAELYHAGNGGFFGCDHFYFVNRILTKQGHSSINW